MARPGRHGLTDDQWRRLSPLLPREKDRSGAPAKLSNRQVVHASLWILKTGAPWRDLPRHMGKWNSIYRRYRRWCLNGVWDDVLRHVSKASDDEWHSLDGTIVRVHQDASGGAGGAEKKWNRKVPRRTNDEDSCASRRARPSARVRRDGWPSA